MSQTVSLKIDFQLKLKISNVAQTKNDQKIRRERTLKYGQYAYFTLSHKLTNASSKEARTG